MKMSSGTRLAAAALVIATCCGLGACERDSTPEGTTEKAAAEATAATPAATPVTPVVIEAQVDRGEEPFEDDLVLLAEGDPDWGEAPLTVQFTVESLIMDQMNEPKFTWNFGDGSAESQEAKPVHTYDKPGNYAVTIKIVDATGETGWDELDIEVAEPGKAEEGADKPR
jgi:PKD repeat protein